MSVETSFASSRRTFILATSVGAFPPARSSAVKNGSFLEVPASWPSRWRSSTASACRRPDGRHQRRAGRKDRGVARVTSQQHAATDGLAIRWLPDQEAPRAASGNRDGRGPVMSAPSHVELGLAFLERLPAIHPPAGRASIGSGAAQSGERWVEFSLDTEHALPWRVLQELGQVLKSFSLECRLPTALMPLSPTPYMNGGVEVLSWVIENKVPDFTLAGCAQWLR